MKNLALAPILLVLLAGCANPNAALYKTAGTVEAAVDHSMSALGDYLRAQEAGGIDGKATRAAATTAYNRYRAAMNLFYTARASASTSAAAGDPGLQTAFKTAAASAGDLIALVNSFLPAAQQLPPLQL